MSSYQYNPIIVALDTPSPIKALRLVSQLKITGVAFKVGFELFAAGGRKIVERIINHDVRVFLDLKFHDIPNTVACASRVVTDLGVWMFNVHASGGYEMMKRAKEVSLETASLKKITPPFVMGVTVLTSLMDLKEFNISKSIEDQVVSLASLAFKAGLDGVVSSAKETARLRENLGKMFCIVTPGIRWKPLLGDDQKRVLSPAEARKQGSDYLVIGRPILEAKRPLKVVEHILASI